MSRARRLVVAALTAALTLAAGGCGGPAIPAAAPTMAAETGPPIRLAVVGDSITDADCVDLAGGASPSSWLGYVVGPTVELVGGWAHCGAQVGAMAAAVTAPLDADVLVILAGTNDLDKTPQPQVEAGLVQIAQSAGTDLVILSSVPPNDHRPASARIMNEHLVTLAHDQGWVWVDAAAGLRQGDLFAPGMSEDGVHPTAAGAQVLGAAIGTALAEAIAGRWPDEDPAVVVGASDRG